MLKWLKDKKKKDNKGFTLVELIIVVAILAILVGLLAPQYTKYVERSRKAADASNLDSLVTAVKVATADQQYSKIIPEEGKKGTVVITIKPDGTSVTYNGSAINEDGALLHALNEYAGNEWKATTLKSNAWKSGEKKDQIAVTATCVIDSNGSVSVTYDPENVKNTLKETKTK